jgi:hypothetical protein
MRERHFVNLSSGVEWIPDLSEFSYVRIESTAIEKADWTRVLRDLDTNFLMALATGSFCHFYDCGARREISKTVSVGVPYIRGILTAVWLRNQEWPVPAITDGEREVKRKLKYFRRFVATDEIQLVGHSRSTLRDGDRLYQRELILEAR